MKKLLTILTTSSAVFLITAGVMLVNKNNLNNRIIYNSRNKKEHKVVNGRLVEIGYYVENGITRIVHIPYDVSVIAADLPREITSLKNAFVTRSNIRWEKKWNTSNITDMSGTFYNTTNINDPTIKEWDTSNVKNMSEMFSYSKGFNQDLSNWDVSKVTNMQSMFEKASDFNNGDKPLDWGYKLKNIKNMNNMFNETPSFTHDLSDWIMNQTVSKNKFGLEETKQPKWKAEEKKPVNDSLTQPQPNSSSDNSLPRANSESSSISNTETESILPKVDENKKQSDDKKEIYAEKDKLTKDENEITKTNNVIKDKETSSIKNDDSLYKIPSSQTKPNTIISKTNSPNAGVITGAVLGSFTILGTTAGLGYYYRKNLKNLYLKSADKIKPSLLKSIDKTKNLYFKSKNKIKDKIAKIKSKK
ncbi:BspA family leucine-rich repeat surface protein [Mycoplasma capricolum]|uniref:BspA family leucine-rich repeat surface protein n=1 Tax=Mycoplasma capricolum TaxID=2095 RepID=UPI0022F3B364|nr:BspA family leucine-rich repeat surface protein [Mycoplasma capricolum]WBX36423.1 BspA family leucine-rich repeat surface protein [Mycoplasma capricolum subsp. capricolum]